MLLNAYKYNHIVSLISAHEIEETPEIAAALDSYLENAQKSREADKNAGAIFEASNAIAKAGINDNVSWEARQILMKVFDSLGADFTHATDDHRKYIRLANEALEAIEI